MDIEGGAPLIRPMRLADLDTAVELLMATSAHDIRYRLMDGLAAVMGGQAGRALVAEQGRRVVGAGKATAEPALPATATMSALVAVEPSARGHGIGTALMDAVVDQPRSAAGVGTFTCAVRDDVDSGRTFAERHGFTVANHDTGMRLDLSGPAADLARVAAVARDAAGVRTRVADLTTDEAVIMDCVGRSLAGPPVAFGDGQEVGSAPTRALIPEGALIILAEDLDEPGSASGVTILARQSGGDEWRVDYTGVDPRRRERDVAAALKTASHVEASRLGARTVTTFNDDSDEPMLRLNRRIGMTPTAGYWGLVRPPA